MMPNAIGSYEITEQIGSGGMATVYKAYQPRLDRHVAIKIMHQNFTQEANFLARFEREARIVARLDHPNIVTVYDYDEYEQQPYLVMKFIEGVTLKDLLRKSTLTHNEALEIISAVAGALHYAHGQGVLHRDVKPSNIILDKRGVPYLTDFGLARLALSGESTMSADSMLGTPHYISPEQAQGKTDLDARTDVYSLGVVLYELLTGRVPFTGDTSFAIIHDHIYNPPPLPSTINPNISPDVEAVLLKALAKDPADRYATPVEMVNAYKQAVSGIPGSTVGAQHAAPSGASPSFHPPPPVSSQPGRIEAPFSADLQGRRNMRKDGREMRREYQRGGGPWSWKPGAKWTHDAYGKWGFFTDAELQEVEATLSDDERIRRRVEKRLEERNGFYGHLGAYIGVNLLMVMIWAFSGGGEFWPMWVFGPWGIGLFFHAMYYYNEYGGGRHRREQYIQQEMERERERLYGQSMVKPKNDFREERPLRDGDSLAGPRVRLTEDGEFTDSFIDDLEQDEQHRKRE